VWSTQVPYSLQRIIQRADERRAEAKWSEVNEYNKVAWPSEAAWTREVVE